MIWEKTLLIELFLKFKIDTFFFFSQKMLNFKLDAFDKYKICARIWSNIEAQINIIQKVGVWKMDLTKKEKKVLAGILKTEIMELNDLIDSESIKRDKAELEKNLKVVEAILAKI